MSSDSKSESYSRDFPLALGLLPSLLSAQVSSRRHFTTVRQDQQDRPSCPSRRSLVSLLIVVVLLHCYTVVEVAICVPRQAIKLQANPNS